MQMLLKSFELDCLENHLKGFPFFELFINTHTSSHAIDYALIHSKKVPTQENYLKNLEWIICDLDIAKVPAMLSSDALKHSLALQPRAFMQAHDPVLKIKTSQAYLTIPIDDAPQKLDVYISNWKDTFENICQKNIRSILKILKKAMPHEFKQPMDIQFPGCVFKVVPTQLGKHQLVKHIIVISQDLPKAVQAWVDIVSSLMTAPSPVLIAEINAQKNFENLDISYYFRSSWEHTPLNELKKLFVYDVLDIECMASGMTKVFDLSFDLMMFQSPEDQSYHYRLILEGLAQDIEAFTQQSGVEVF